MNSQLPLSRRNIKEEEVVDYINPVDNTVASAALKGTEETMLGAMKPFCCVMHFDLE